MRIASLPDFLLQRIERDPAGRSQGKAINRQIYDVIRTAILDQSLPAGLQLPSSRYLAQELTVSRNTVTFAYEQLLAEGYLETRNGAGTFVADTEPEQAGRASPAPCQPAGQDIHAGLSKRGTDLFGMAGVGKTQWGAFMPGVPDVTQFPNKIWSRLQNKYWRRSRSDLLTYSSGGGHLPLREAIADYLRVARSVNCNADQVLITTGIHQSMDLVTRMLSDHGDHAWVEDPCYWGTRSVLRSLGVRTVAIPVDDEGLQLLPEQMCHPPRFIVATPSHQYPMGMVMSLTRRRALLDYAASHQTWVVEDDYDSEFRYGSRPIASLQGLDTHQRVLYLGTFSKTLFPGLRIGYLVVPEALTNAFATGLSELYRCGNTYTQAVLAEFMTEGHFASHIRRMRQVYAERMRLLRAAITRHFDERIILTSGEAGLHLALALPDHVDDNEISRQAGLTGIVVRPLSLYYQNRDAARRGLMLGYASVPDDQIQPAFDLLASVIKSHWTDSGAGALAP